MREVMEETETVELYRGWRIFKARIGTQEGWWVKRPNGLFHDSEPWGNPDIARVCVDYVIETQEGQ